MFWRNIKAFKSISKLRFYWAMAPCDWHPGDKTIIESVETAGQIWKQWEPKNKS